MVETLGCLHPHIFDLLRRKARRPSASIRLDTERSYALACHYRPCGDQEEICLVSGWKRPRRACARRALGKESRRVRRDWTWRKHLNTRAARSWMR